MDLLEYSRKVVQAELTWISRHTPGNPHWWRKVLLRVKWLMRNLSYKVIGRRPSREERIFVTQFELVGVPSEEP